VPLNIAAPRENGRCFPLPFVNRPHKNRPVHGAGSIEAAPRGFDTRVAMARVDRAAPAGGAHCMSVASPSRVDDASPASRAIDLGRPFIPDAFCPFGYLPREAIAALPPEIILRQNQLQALYVLEMIQLFETLGRRALAPLARETAGTPLGATLVEFIADETRHSAEFAALNRAAAPEIFGSGDSFFVRVPRWTTPLVRLLCSGPRRFPFWPWLMLMQEERALFLSRAYLREADQLEPHFVAVHRKHAADEAHHVGWDEELIDAVWPRASRRKRAFNARLLTWLIAEFLHAPRRGGARLLAQLAREFPAHAARLLALQAPLARLGSNDAWSRTTRSPEMMPRSLNLLKRWPELAPLARFIREGTLRG
jgi:hypothetical protein